MSADVKQRLIEARDEAEAEVTARKEAHAELAEINRLEASPRSHTAWRQSAAALAAARERLELSTAALKRFEELGDELGLWVEGDRVLGTVAVRIAPGTSQEQRLRAIADELDGPLSDVASRLGAVLGSSWERYCRERPGRDAQGRVVLEVFARVERDVVVPALPGQGKLRR